MGDFERTFGAGANADSIIAANSHEHRFQSFDTKWIDFLEFNDAVEFAKRNPGSVLTRSKTRGTSFDDGFRVTPPNKGMYFRFTHDLQEQYACSAVAEEFAIRIPIDLDIDPEFEISSDEWKRYIEKGIDVKSVSDSVAIYLGFAIHQVIRRKPLSAEGIQSSLNKVDMGLAPFSEDVCFIFANVSQAPTIEGVLVTADGVTTLIRHGLEEKLYMLIT